MQRIDAHQHFWQFNPSRDSWITEEMAVIQRDFLPHHLQPLLQQHGFDGCVLVQNSQPEPENVFLLQAAQQHDFVKGVVGWVDFLAEDVEERLAQLATNEKLKGFRYVLQGNPDKALMLRPAFKSGIAKLQKHGFTYDILIYPDQLGYTEQFVSAFPDQPFVIDHLAKPHIRTDELKEWRQDMLTFAKHEHVSCKVSGLVAEADWKNWKQADFVPYLDTVVETFGMNRLMFGSDWPVCLVAAQYGQVLGIVEDYFSSFSKTEQAAFFGGNATAFYRLT